jgi:cell wall-associated NlpC family hydrolase
MTLWYSRPALWGGAAGLAAVLTLPAAAEAAPDPYAEVARLNGRVDHLVDQYDKATTELRAARLRLSALDAQVAGERRVYEDLRDRAARLAVQTYEHGTPDLTVLTSADPDVALARLSAVTALSNSRDLQVKALLDSAQRLGREQAASRTALGDLTRRRAALKRQKVTVERAIGRQRALLRRAGDPIESPGGGGGATYDGPASGPARKAVEYAYAQLGKPYIYGGTGPRGYDCSGLTMMAWRAAGVNLPRVVPDQYHAIHHVTRAALRPGDLVFFDGLGHQGIYVGNGRFIHAPHTGTVVKFESLSNPWYTAHFVGAGRP